MPEKIDQNGKVHIRTEIPKRDNTLIEVYRGNEGISKSEVIRIAVKEFIENHKEEILEKLDKTKMSVGGENND